MLVFIRSGCFSIYSMYVFRKQKYVSMYIYPLSRIRNTSLVSAYFVKVKVKNTLFNLGMVTYSYECQDIIQFALKRLPGG
jgi:hypothetical protein